MEIGHFYYIDDQYFKDFPDPYLMQNKEYATAGLWKVSKIKALGGITWVYRGKCSSKGLR